MYPIGPTCMCGAHAFKSQTFEYTPARIAPAIQYIHVHAPCTCVCVCLQSRPAVPAGAGSEGGPLLTEEPAHHVSMRTHTMSRNAIHVHTFLLILIIMRACSNYQHVCVVCT
jgi:hypothetical protein